METKMTWGGIGPKIGLMSLPYVLLSVSIIYFDKELLPLNFISNSISLPAGYILFSLGILFLISTAFTFLKGFNNGKLVTTGTYSLCRNPIYASWIIFIIPGFALILQSGLILTISLVIYINFKIAIHGEYVLLKRNFGEEYERYEKSVNELFPIPRFFIKKKTS